MPPKNKKKAVSIEPPIFVEGSSRGRMQPRISALSRMYSRMNEPVKSDGRIPRRGRNDGKLSQLMDMPVDVFLEIASHMKPLDLLQLSRVSQHFRRIFTSKSSRSLWISARKNVSHLPDPPAILSETKYAALLFEYRCFACGVGRSPKVDHALSVRFCGACWKANVVKGKTLLKQHRDANPTVLTLIPHEYHMYGGVDPKMNGEWNTYYVPEFEAVLDHYLSLPEDQREEYIEERRVHAQTMHEHARAVYQWDVRVKEEQMKEDEKARQSRQKSIEEKLLAMGYTEEDFPPSWHPSWSTYVSQPRVLTPRIWKHIEPKLVEAIKQYREEERKRALESRVRQRCKELHDFYGVYVAQLPEDFGPLPVYSQLNKLTAINAFLRENNAETPVTQERFDAIVPQEMVRYTADFTMATIKLMQDKLRALQGRVETVKATIATAATTGNIASESHVLRQLENEVNKIYDLQAELPFKEEVLSTAEQETETGEEEEEEGDDTSMDEEGVAIGATPIDKLAYTEEDLATCREVLSRARLLFKCDFCYGGDRRHWNFLELAAHIRAEHLATPMSPYRTYGPYQFDLMGCVEVVDILNALDLPRNTKYADINKKIACMCANPKFVQPASFGQLIGHIQCERDWMETAQRRLRHINDTGEVLHNDHQLTGPKCCVKLIHDGEEFPTFEFEPVDLEYYGPHVTCNICHRLMDSVPYSLFSNTVNSFEGFVHHVRSKHLREPVQADMRG
ncbi:hypothetical protein NM688_g2947 [Phlebia brevispora]|uniref:Uncharacterized protein n=1 Tax=Phlebia brevispora TaxID=194682 RepID=A0ACC1T7C1_9APHY|nr:hypothetical protein NM688_g2947 [Phlebia brevispora]